MQTATAFPTIDLVEVAPQAAQLPAVQPQMLGVTMTPNQMLSLALQRGASTEQLEKFMALAERWERAEAERAYNVAFAAFRDEAVVIIKNRQVTDGPLKNKKYAELFAVVNAVTPALSKHGLSASWKITTDTKDWIAVTCTLKHHLGHSESVTMGGPADTGGAKNPIQARASTVTYLERYTLKAICGVAEQEDDNDGRGAGKVDLFYATEMLNDAKTRDDLEKAWKKCAGQCRAAQDIDSYTKLRVVMVARGEKIKLEAA